MGPRNLDRFIMADSDLRIAILAISVGTLLILPEVISKVVAEKLGPLGYFLELLGIL